MDDDYLVDIADTTYPPEDPMERQAYQAMCLIAEIIDSKTRSPDHVAILEQAMLVLDQRSH